MENDTDGSKTVPAVPQCRRVSISQRLEDGDGLGWASVAWRAVQGAIRRKRFDEAVRLASEEGLSDQDAEEAVAWLKNDMSVQSMELVRVQTNEVVKGQRYLVRIASLVFISIPFFDVFRDGRPAFADECDIYGADAVDEIRLIKLEK